MTTQLPPNLQLLFAARPTPRWVPPVDFPPEQRTTSKIDGVAAFVDLLREHKENDSAKWMDFDDGDAEHMKTVTEDFVKDWTDSRHQHRVNKRLEKQEKQKKLLTEDAKNFDPSKDPKIDGDPMKTLFVSRLSYKVTERELEKEFGRFGPLRKVWLLNHSSSAVADSMVDQDCEGRSAKDRR